VVELQQKQEQALAKQQSSEEGARRGRKRRSSRSCIRRNLAEKVDKSPSREEARRGAGKAWRTCSEARRRNRRAEKLQRSTAEMKKQGMSCAEDAQEKLDE